MVEGTVPGGFDKQCLAVAAESRVGQRFGKGCGERSGPRPADRTVDGDVRMVRGPEMGGEVGGLPRQVKDPPLTHLSDVPGAVGDGHGPHRNAPGGEVGDDTGGRGVLQQDHGTGALRQRRVRIPGDQLAAGDGDDECDLFDESRCGHGGDHGCRCPWWAVGMVSVSQCPQHGGGACQGPRDPARTGVLPVDNSLPIRTVACGQLVKV